MQKKKCLTPKCKRKETDRGVCRPCYYVYWRHVNAGKETWESLEEKGAVNKPKKRGRKSKAGAYLEQLEVAGKQ